MDATNTWAWLAVAGLAMGLGGCTMDIDDSEPGEEPLTESASTIGVPQIIPCSGVHPSSPGGNLLITRDAFDDIVATAPIVCTVMGLVGENLNTGEAYEVVADAAMITNGGGTNVAMTCGLCQSLTGGPPGGPPPGSTVPIWGRLTTPSSVTSIGTMGDYPYGPVPGPGGLWHWWSYAPGGSSETSFCDNGAFYAAPLYGPLSNPYGYELVDSGSGVTWGSSAYQQYDPVRGYIRAASLPLVSAAIDAKLKPVPRWDACR